MFNRLKVELDARKQSLGLRMGDLITLPDGLRNLLSWMIRKKQVSLADIIEFVGNDERAAKDLLAEALSKGYVREIEMRGVTSYCVRLAPKRPRDRLKSIWQALEARVENQEGEQ